MNEKKNANLQNVDYGEIAKFEEIALEWWDVDGKFKLLHQINPLRLSWIAQYSDGLFGKKVLDVGCGGGILSESMAQEGANVTGLDVGLEPLRIARLHAMKSGVNINYIQQTVEEHTGQYDVITCMEMLEHVPNPRSVVQACARLVKPGGEVFFSTINRSSKAWLIAILGAEYVLRILPRGTHKMKKFIRPSKLLHWVDETTLSERHITGLQYNLLINKFKLASSVDINYMIHTHRTEF